MLGRQAGAYLVGGDGAGGISFQCVIGRANLAVKLGLDGSITRE